MHSRIWSVPLRESRFPHAQQQPPIRGHVPTSAGSCQSQAPLASAAQPVLSLSISKGRGLILHPLSNWPSVFWNHLLALRLGSHQWTVWVAGVKESWEPDAPAQPQTELRICRQRVSSPALHPRRESPTWGFSGSCVTLNGSKLAVSGWKRLAMGCPLSRR